MVKIRLARGGAKKRPFYHVVATDSRTSRDGRFIERLGFFNPVARGKETELLLDLDKIDAWTAKGAQVSERVTSLVREFKRSGGADALAAAKAAEAEKAAKARAEHAAAEQAKLEELKAEAAATDEARSEPLADDTSAEAAKADDTAKNAAPAEAAAPAKDAAPAADAAAAPGEEPKDS